MYRKYITILVNENEFVEYKFGEDAMQKQSRLLWKTLTPTVNTQHIIVTERTNIKLDDSLLGLNFLFREEASGFRYDQRQG